MAERWQTSEGRAAAVYIDDSNGAPASGLTCTATTAYKDGTLNSPAATVTALTLPGFYRVDLATAPSKDVLVLVDSGQTGAARWVPIEIPVGGYVDKVDAATSTRAPATDTATLLSRFTATRAGLLDQLALLDVAVSSRAAATDTATLLARLTAVRAGLLDQLALVDVAISTRARPSDVAITVNPPAVTLAGIPTGQVS